MTNAQAIERGRKGGQTTAARYGREHMQAIGRKGFQVTCERYWNGDRERFVRRLVELGLMAQDPAPWNGAWQYPKRTDEPW